MNIDYLNYKNYNSKIIDDNLTKAYQSFNGKIIVLDDDPTGTQTVSDIFVYTKTDKETLKEAFLSKEKTFYILTNSRSFTVSETIDYHQNLITQIENVSKELKIDYLIVSRGDSTLRGHWPLETKVLKDGMAKTIDGEIICPFFLEGNRYTINNTHYLLANRELIPIAKTEFAKDQTFGYQSSNLIDYIKEKTNNKYNETNTLTISLEELRNYKYDEIYRKLLTVTKFNKVIVNATTLEDLKIFVSALYEAIKTGKNFLFRTAASFVKALGNFPDKELLSGKQLLTNSNNGGLIIVGSHTNKTTKQLENIKNLTNYAFYELDVNHIIEDDNNYLDEIVMKIKEKLINKTNVVIYTTRRVITLAGDTKEKALLRSVKISNALQSIVKLIEVKPAFIIAKGGITSSDVATKGLNITKGFVLGQIDYGIPVWLTDEKSLYPNIPYIIFPGNVGFDNTLLNIVKKLNAESR